MSKNAKSKHLQTQHGNGAHCTNHYTRSVMQLESVLEERLAQLSLLVQENAELKRREAALQSAVGSLAGSVSAATTAVLVSSAADAADVRHATVRPHSPETPSGSSWAGCSFVDHKDFLLRMQQREAAVQRIMSQLGGMEYEEMYSSWLLRRAFSCPTRAAAHLAMSKAERVQFVLGTVQKLGLLIGKYDLLHHPSTAMGTPREQLDRLVDDLNERTLAFCLLAPPTRQLEMACLNMETGLPEPYPQGWWAVVIDAMQLTDDQKAALKICWEKVKPIKLALTAQYELVSGKLERLQRKALDQQHRFELQAEHAIDAAIHAKAAQRWQQPDQQPQHTQQQWLLQQQAQQQQQQQQKWVLEQQQQQQQQRLMEQQQQQSLLLQQEQLAMQWEQWQHQHSQQHVQQQQQRSPALQAQPQQVVSPGGDVFGHAEQDLFQFCRALLGSELDGLPDSMEVKETAAELPGSSMAPPAAACTTGEAAATGVAGHQQQLYASRIAPLQPQQQQQHFMQFSPAVAAAAAASDQSLWLHGLNSDPAASPTDLSPAGLSPVQPSSDQQHMDTSLSAGAWPNSDGRMHNSSSRQDPSTSCFDPSGTSKSADGSSRHSSPPTHSSTPSPDITAAGARSAPDPAPQPPQRRCYSDGAVPTPSNGTAAGSMLSGQEQPGLLLQVSDRAQRKLERQMDRITAQLKMQQYCMHTYVLNICSKKQMALKYVNCYPWVPESFSMCEALDEMGW